jgi:hypothetical protein
MGGRGNADALEMSDGTQFILILGLMAGLTYAIAMAAWYKLVKPNALKVPSRTPTAFDELVGLLVLIRVGIGVWFWWSGGFHHKALSNSSSSHVSDFSHVLEVACVEGSGFDDNNLCLKPDYFAGELEFRVNTTTQKVLITIVKNDGNYGDGRILDDCSVFDASNWKCHKTVGKPEGIHWVEENGMSHGRYYRRSLDGANDYYDSSISGETFWALHDHSISELTAMESTGYSRESLVTFQGSCFFKNRIGNPCLLHWVCSRRFKEEKKRLGMV